MKKMLLLSLITALSIATFSAETQVTAQLHVIDPGTEVSLNLSSTAAAFGDILIKSGEVSLPAPINFALEGTKAQNAHIAVPETIELTSGSNKITVATELAGSGLTSHTHNKYTILRSDSAMDSVSGNKVEGTLNAKMNLAGTEVSGRYSGSIPVYAFYN